MPNNKDWWKSAVFYQIYPRSFYDASGNGIGDINGIREKLPYLDKLGVDALWISPFFKSPQKDYGYDVSDYKTIDPMFGSNADFKKLLDEANNLDIKIIVDLVLSHTSDEHAWFKESRQNKDNAKADWYVWADPKPDGSPPNNWQSVFGGSAWSFDMRRGQYYLHQFLKEQPDLNFHNTEVRQEILDVFKFWLEFGVDGFRIDALTHCFSDLSLQNNPPNPNPAFNSQFGGYDLYTMQLHEYDRDQTETEEFCKDIRSILDQYPGSFAIGEVSRGVKESAAYCDEKEKLHTAYSFSLLTGDPDTLNASFFREHLEEAMSIEGFWPSWAFSNHDMIRTVTRWGGEAHQHNPDFAKMLIALLTTMRGTPFLYEGEELGLTDAKIPFEKIQDPWGKFLWPEWQGRDGCRTPMPWTSEKPHGGFSASESWLPIPDEHLEKSVQKQEKDAQSVLNFTCAFLAWRKTQPSLQAGNMTFLDHGEDVLVYTRDDTLCVFNLTGKEASIEINQDAEALNLFGLSLSGRRISIDSFGFGFLRLR